MKEKRMMVVFTIMCQYKSGVQRPQKKRGLFRKASRVG